MAVTFHRAFDMARDARRSLETLIGLGVERVLTSGLDSSALEGLPALAELVAQAGSRIIVMPGGGISERNAGRIVAGSGARELHISGRRTVESAMRYRKGHIFMGGMLRPPEYSLQVADSERIRAVVAAAQG
jgi:copper homeostasis protein